MCADSHGYAAIGLTGVWGWVKPKEEGDTDRCLHPDLKAFKLSGRTVYIVFDSDAVYKDDVRYAEWELVRILTAAGAVVRIVRIPAKLGGPKVGLDDFVAANGKAAFDELLQKAGPPAKPPLGFSNTIWRPKEEKPAEFAEIPRSVVECAAELVGKSDGWPRCVAGSLVVPDQDGGVRPVGNPNQLFAFIGWSIRATGASGITWNEGDRGTSPSRSSTSTSSPNASGSSGPTRYLTSRPSPASSTQTRRPSRTESMKGRSARSSISSPRDRRGRITPARVRAHAALGRSTRATAGVPDSRPRKTTPRAVAG